MKSKTSFFNATVLRKDIFRYAPVWGLYAAGLTIFLLFGGLLSIVEDAEDFLLHSMIAMSVFSMILGGVSALMVFGDLFRTRLCYATHAMPLRREGWFLTHFTAGLLFGIVPNLFVSLCFLLLLGEFWYLALLWLAATTLQYLFFFGVGAFSAVCAGNRLGAVAVYLTLNLGVWLIGAYAEDVFVPLLHGLEYRWDFLNLFIPIAHMTSMDLVDYSIRPFFMKGLIPGDWVYMGIVAAIGLVFAFLAVLIYRKRQLETSGDFLSLPAAKPVFLIVYTLLVSKVIDTVIPYAGLFVGLFIGVFTGKMLLERTVRVFKGKNFLFFGALSATMALALVLTLTDVAGLTRFVPDTDEVQALYFYERRDRYRDERFSTSDPVRIDAFREFHAELAEDDFSINEDGVDVIVYLEYQLESGRTVLRKYAVPVDSAPGQFARQQLSSWDYVFTCSDWEEYVGGVKKLDVKAKQENSSHWLDAVTSTLTDPEQIRGLLEAMKADCDAGNMAQYSGFHPDEDYSVRVSVYDAHYYEYAGVFPDRLSVYLVELQINDCCQHTLAYLDSLNLNANP